MQKMSNDLSIYSGGGAISRGEARRASRSISRGQLAAQVRSAAVDNSADLALVKLENLSMATGNAMQQVTRIAMTQRHLELMAPEAAGRLSYLADSHMFGCADLLSELRRDMGQIR